MHLEPFEVLPDLFEEQLHAQLPEAASGRCHLFSLPLCSLADQLKEPIPFSLRDGLGYLTHVVARIAIRGQRGLMAKMLEVTGLNAEIEGLHARAGIVHVVLTLDLVARLFEHPG